MPISENMVQEIVQESLWRKNADCGSSGRKTWDFQGYE